MLFVPDQAMNPVSISEPLNNTTTMFPDPFDEAGCYTYVQGTVLPAGEYVDAGLVGIHFDPFRYLSL